MRFDSVLVANRGEVARRVIAAARTAGLFTVAVYSAADCEAAHVTEADRAIQLGPAPATASYLSIDAVMAALAECGAGAIHPGYGFLAESAELAQRCEDAGVVFVGPSARVIAEMGRKDEARRIAAGLGLPVVPAVEGDDHDQLAAAALRELGLPVLIKAVAGGGGKAMHVARDERELRRLLPVAEREARAAFGDGTLFVERLVEGARHVEVQLLGDRHGNIVHLLDRDCSVQRRHQKVIEEAPATAVSAAVRAELQHSAVSLGKGIGYENAGTVEFLVRGDEHYFLEMNTRLQVEHRVTEAIVGRDLVALQFAIAQGQELSFSQQEVRASGHAIEARVYAEDPAAAFLPQAGRAEFVRWPRRVLVDEALQSGDEVSAYYDPMLAKMVAHAPTRDAARRRLVEAIDETAVVGLTTNLGYVRDVLCAADFVSGSVDTEWLERDFVAPAETDEGPARAAAAALLIEEEKGDGPFGLGDGWRAAAPAAASIIELTGASGPATLRSVPGSRVVEDGARRFVVLGRPAPGLLLLGIDGEEERVVATVRGGTVLVSHRGVVHRFTPPSGAAQELPTPTSGAVLAPVPGIVTARAVEVGDRVVAGQQLLSLESMKTEIAIRAPLAGSVAALPAETGAHVRLGELLVEIVPTEEQAS